MLRDSSVRTQSATKPPMAKPAQQTPAKVLKRPIVDASKFLSLLNNSDVEFRFSQKKSEHTLTVNPLPAGTEVTVERAAVAIVRNNFVNQVCDNCFTFIPPVQGADKKTRLPGGVACSTECTLVRYCSDACRDQAAPRHKLECATAAKLDEIRKTHSIDLDLLRLALRVLALEKIQTDADEPIPAQFTPIRFLADLPTRRETFEDDWMTTVSAAVTDFIAALPEELKPLASNDKIIDLACRINIFAHGFSNTRSRNTNECVGLFPMIGHFFNHSCEPNCLLVSKDDGCVAVRTLKNVEAGQELSVSYVDLFQPREQRRRDLLVNKHFWCECRRCNALLSNSIDRFMDGLLCRRCKNGVMVFEETKEVADINALMKDVSVLDDEIKGKRAECETCVARMPVSELVTLLKDAIESYAHSMLLVRQRRLPEARAALEAYIKNYEKGNLLHLYNSYLLNTMVPLMNTCIALNDLHAAVTWNKAIIQRMAGSRAMPENSPEIAEFWYHLGDLTQRLARNRAGKASRGGSALINRYHKDAKQAYTNAHKIYAIAYGRDHPKTIASLARRNEIKNEQL